MTSVIELINVWKIYRMGSVETVALRGINLSIGRNELVAIMGPSGSGKSTLLNIMGLLDKPTSGQVLFNGLDVTKLSSDKISEIRNLKIGFVFQQFNLINRLTVLENIELPLVARGIPRKTRIEKVIEAIKMVGGDISWLSKKPNQLSGGQQQRVAIARAIVGEPDLILADEPTGNLDTASARIVTHTFRKLNEKGLTIVIVTHNIEVANCAEKIYVLRDGAISELRVPESDKCLINT
ncbi:MAG: ABC transporter ATP-binding protein [Desulfurococcaceae archaeon]|uniref:ABC transporter ATP-binding protein n=1 Tax=Staphylothermus marinus TaxID=2280 RepID=A0A7C4JN05_STAMA